MAQAPVYFLSHGGPNLMYDTDHVAYSQLEEIGKEITTQVKPKAVVVVSAHWEAAERDDGTDAIEVNFGEEEDIIHDFHNFPPHYYREIYPNKGSNAVAARVASALEASGLNVKPVARGLDHGVWVSFRVAFNPDSNPLTVPIVQFSLPPASCSNRDTYHQLGAALRPLRAAGILIIASGMPVHNLSALRQTRLDPTPLPYTVTFMAALDKAMTAPAEEREAAMKALLARQDLVQAHPSPEHLWPAFVGVGAAGSEKGNRLLAKGEGGIGWGYYRWGEVAGVNLVTIQG